MMKLARLVPALTLSLAGISYAGDHAGDLAAPHAATPPRLEKLWQTDEVLKVPESVRYDADRQVLYVSNIDGTEIWTKDGQGSISRLGLDGTVIDAQWITGLHGPKGLALKGDRLYVGDIDAVVTIDIDKGKIVERYPVPGATKINDVSVGDDGTIYFTDSAKGDLHKLVNGTVTNLLTGCKRINGVLHSQGRVAVCGQRRPEPAGSRRIGHPPGRRHGGRRRRHRADRRRRVAGLLLERHGLPRHPRRRRHAASRRPRPARPAPPTWATTR